MPGVSWSSFSSAGNHFEGEQGACTKYPTISESITDGENGWCENFLLYLKLLCIPGLASSEEGVQACALSSKSVGRTGFKYTPSSSVPKN